MLEAVKAALFYTGAGSAGLSVGLFIAGATWNQIQSSQLDLPIYQELPQGNY